MMFSESIRILWWWEEEVDLRGYDCGHRWAVLVAVAFHIHSLALPLTPSLCIHTYVDIVFANDAIM